MSFRVDLWNGFDLIKSQYNSTYKKLKTINKLLKAYYEIENNYCRSLETIYKENKDISKPEFLLDESFQKIIEIFNNELQNRKEYNTFIQKQIIDPINSYLEKPKLKFNKCFSDNNENKDNFNRAINSLIEKQNSFHSQCKELGSYIAQMEVDMINKTNKTSKNRCQKVLEKVKSEKEYYLSSLKETNKERENYNIKTEKLLNELEAMYRKLVKKLSKSLFEFSKKRIEFLKNLYDKEKKEYDEIHSKVELNEEITNFIIKNATKEFPMIKFEFCPIKYSALNKYIKNKYNKIPNEELPKIYKAIQNYLDSNNIFKDDFIFKSNKKANNDFFARRISFFTKKAPQINNKETENEKTEIQINKELIEKYLTDLFFNKEKEKKNILKKEEKNKIKEKDISNNNEIKNPEKENKNNQILENEFNNNLKENKKENINLIKDNKITQNENIKNIEKANNVNVKNEIKDNKNEGNTPENKDNIKNNIEDDSNDVIKINDIKIEKEKDKNNEPNKNDEKDLSKIKGLLSANNENTLFYIEVFIKKLSYLRSKGNYQITEYVYKIIIELFEIILKENKDNDYILKNVLILCHTFYKLENDEKIYLQEGIKEQTNSWPAEAWHRVINYSLNLNNTDKDLNNLRSNEKKEKIIKESEIVVISYLCDIKQFTNNEKIFNDVKNYYKQVYNLDEDKINIQVEDYLKMVEKQNKINKNNDKKDKIIDFKNINGDTNIKEGNVKEELNKETPGIEKDNKNIENEANKNNVKNEKINEESKVITKEESMENNNENGNKDGETKINNELNNNVNKNIEDNKINFENNKLNSENELKEEINNKLNNKETNNITQESSEELNSNELKNVENDNPKENKDKLLVENDTKINIDSFNEKKVEKLIIEDNNNENNEEKNNLKDDNNNENNEQNHTIKDDNNKESNEGNKNIKEDNNIEINEEKNIIKEDNNNENIEENNIIKDDNNNNNKNNEERNIIQDVNTNENNEEKNIEEKNKEEKNIKDDNNEENCKENNIKEEDATNGNEENNIIDNNIHELNKDINENDKNLNNSDNKKEEENK